MAEYPQRNRTASEYLEMMAELVPYFNDLIPGDVSVSVIRDGKYIAYMPADTMDLKNKIGDPVKGAVSQRCIETGQPQSALVSKEKSNYGVAYAATRYRSRTAIPSSVAPPQRSGSINRKKSSQSAAN